VFGQNQKKTEGTDLNSAMKILSRLKWHVLHVFSKTCEALDQREMAWSPHLTSQVLTEQTYTFTTKCT